ncbi:MAG: hypothetical protein QOH97_5598 [Actinoplanes sp.]|jgi:hypothetical protein|nr:hypothetical protein [Actinoplanes sp.]
MSGDDGQTTGTFIQIRPPAGGPTEVDVDTLALAIPWLEGLKTYLQTTLRKEVVRMAVTDQQSKVIFGTFGSASAVAGKHERYVESAVNSYRAIAKSLDVASRATKDIVQNYKDAEHNNLLTVQKVDTTFASESSPGHSSGSATTAGSTTAGSTTTASSITASSTTNAGSTTTNAGSTTTDSAGSTSPDQTGTIAQ